MSKPASSAVDYDVCQNLAEVEDPACAWAAANHVQVHGRHVEDGDIVADFRFSVSYSLLGAVALPDAA